MNNLSTKHRKRKCCKNNFSSFLWGVGVDPVFMGAQSLYSLEALFKKKMTKLKIQNACGSSRRRIASAGPCGLRFISCTGNPPLYGNVGLEKINSNQRAEVLGGDYLCVFSRQT